MSCQHFVNNTEATVNGHTSPTTPRSTILHLQRSTCETLCGKQSLRYGNAWKWRQGNRAVTDRQESPGYTLRVGKRFTTCSCTKGLYFEDLKLKREEEGEGGGRWAIYIQRVSGDIAWPIRGLYTSIVAARAVTSLVNLRRPKDRFLVI